MKTRHGSKLTRDQVLRADAVVVGSGAGGGMASHVLARAGLRVLVLEEGPSLSQQDMSQHEDDMLGKLYQERGGRTASDFAIRVMGGRNVGGSTVHNINLCKRAPAPVLDHWRDHYAVTGCSETELGADFEAVEQGMISVTPLQLDLTDYKSIHMVRVWDLTF